MPAVFFPTSPYAAEATPRLLTYGSKQRGILGGPTTPIERLGSRWGIDITMPPMMAEPNGRIWVARLVRGQALDGVYWKWPQPDLDLNPATNSDGQVGPIDGPGGRYMNLVALKPGQTVREGQFISILSASRARRYLHMIKFDTTANASGVAFIQVEPAFRVQFAAGDAVHVLAPYVEGLLIGDTRDWNLSTARHTGLQFSIEERE